MGARPEPVPQVVQTPASSMSALLGEKHDILQAIMSIPRERQLQGAAEEFESWTCLCGMPCHIFEQLELGGSEMGVRLQIASCKCVCRLLFLLSDWYLRLGRAYKEDGQFSLALRAVELACLTRGCHLPYYVDREQLEKLQQLKDHRDPKAAEFAWRMRRLTPPPKEAFLPKGDFDIQALILAGDAYLEAQRTFDDSHAVIPYQEGEELKMSQDVEEEVYRVLRTCECFSSYVGSYGLAKNNLLPKIIEHNWGNNLLAAAGCYSYGLSLPSSIYAMDQFKGKDSQSEGSGFLRIAHRKVGFVWHECGRRLAELGWHAKDETDNYFIKAIDAFYRGKDVPNFALALCSRIEYHRKLADFRETQLNPDQGRKKIIEKTRVKYIEVLDLCREAKDRLKEWGEGLDKEVDLEEAHTCLNLGKILMENDEIYHVKHEKPTRKGRISADGALQEAIKLYSALDCTREVADSQFLLGCVLRDRLRNEYGKSDAHRAGEVIETIIDSWLKVTSWRY